MLQNNLKAAVAQESLLFPLCLSKTTRMAGASRRSDVGIKLAD
jgi:hypothetical protein